MADILYTFCPMCTAPMIEKVIYNAPRRTCPQCGFILFLEPKLVTVAVVEHNGKYLLCRRNMEPGKGLWSFCGGYVDRGENVEEAALREVKEETNLDVQLERLLGVYSEKGQPHVVIVYLASVLNHDISPLRPQAEEVSEIAFFSLDTFPTLAFPTDIRILNVLRHQT